jgi:rSAM/selenodomain-associated transferase 2
MKLSVIIPVFNEEDSIAELVQYLKSANSFDHTEILVVDGGSSDATIEKAEKAGARVIISPVKGRAAQMNEGARRARGEVFYFLHADTYPPLTYVSDIKQQVAKGVKAGCYRLTFDLNHPLLRFYSWFTRFDVDLFRFGDQSLFITREIFVSINGYSDQLIVMEDQDIVRTIKKVTAFKILPSTVKTSARKYQDVGIIKLQFIFTMILVMYYVGFSQEKLVWFYRKWIG